MANVDTLIQLWKNEGFQLEKLKEETDPENSNLVWQLYRLYGDDFYDDYGRHAILQCLINKKTNELLNHEIFNVSERLGENPSDFPCIGNREWIKQS